MNRGTRVPAGGDQRSSLAAGAAATLLVSRRTRSILYAMGAGLGTVFAIMFLAALAGS